jgi:hypothetical protein
MTTPEPHDPQHVHRAELRFTCGEQTFMKTVEGTDEVIAAWLRTVADAFMPQPTVCICPQIDVSGAGEDPRFIPGRRRPDCAAHTDETASAS